MNAYQLGAALTAATLSILFAGAAQAAPTGTASAILCSTQSGIESLYAFHEAEPGASVADGIAAVNAANASADCRMLAFVYEPGEIVATLRVDGAGIDVRKVSVLAKCSDRACTESKSEFGYSAFPLTPTT